jgi:hypothetical protein
LGLLFPGLKAGAFTGGSLREPKDQDSGIFADFSLLFEPEQPDAFHADHFLTGLI